MLKNLCYLIDNPFQIHLISCDKKKKNIGKLEVNIIPTDESGWGEVPDEMIPNTPEDLLDQRIDFAVEIKRAIDLPEHFCRDVYVEYNFYLDDQPYQTPIIPGKHQNPIFDYRYHHTVHNVSENFLKYLKINAVCFKVFGFAD